MRLSYVTLCAVAVILSACASKPKPAPFIPQQVEAERPTPPASSQDFVETAPLMDPLARGNGSAFNAPVPGSTEDFIAASGEDRIYFGYDSYDLDSASRDVLRRQANWLTTYSNVSAVIAGNADERGTREYNLALGARRADSAKEYLVSVGIDPRRLTTVSFGKERPIDARSNSEGWARNRNVHTNLTSGVTNASAF